MKRIIWIALVMALMVAGPSACQGGANPGGGGGGCSSCG